jgi:hypothetical protein
MSHIVTIQSEVRDPAAVAAACRRLSLAEPISGTASLFSGDASGLLVRLPDWHYPVVCQIDRGVLVYDNFEGCWGDQAHLDRFLQAYAVEKAKLEARRQSHSVVEQPLADGSIKLTIQLGAQQ